MKFENYKQEKLKNSKFREEYEREKQLVELSIKIIEERQRRKLTQKALARLAGVTQQQLSKTENAISGNIQTYLKVLNALNMTLTTRKKQSTADPEKPAKRAEPA